jgi:hypothetical protein
MVIIPASAAVAEGLMFTVNQITWTTRAGGIMAMALEENQIQSAATMAVGRSSQPRSPLLRQRRRPL